MTDKNNDTLASREAGKVDAQPGAAKSRIPNVYRNIGPVTGLPLNWRDDVTGELPSAVRAYLNHRVDGAQLTGGQLLLVRDFLRHFIAAPCWNHMVDVPQMADELTGLRRDVLNIRTPDEVGDWISRCVNLGIDPL